MVDRVGAGFCPAPQPAGPCHIARQNVTDDLDRILMQDQPSKFYYVITGAHGMHAMHAMLIMHLKAAKPVHHNRYCWLIANVISQVLTTCIAVGKSGASVSCAHMLSSGCAGTLSLLNCQ